jgi:integrase
VAEGRAYATHRLARGASNASVNRELSLLRRAFRLAHAGSGVLFVPQFEFLREPPARSGFLERRQLDAIVAELPTWLRPVLTALYILGWRKREVLTLRVNQADMVANTITLDPEQSKTGVGRVAPMTDEVRKIVQKQLASAKRIQRKKRKIDVPLFHRPSGRAIGSFRKRWVAACIAAGYPGANDTRPGVLLHDFRRSAARNLTRSGTAEQVAMKLLGHKSSSTFRRYRIVSEDDLQQAAERLDTFFETQKQAARQKGRVQPFSRRATAKAKAS